MVGQHTSRRALEKEEEKSFCIRYQVEPALLDELDQLRQLGRKNGMQKARNWAENIKKQKRF